MPEERKVPKILTKRIVLTPTTSGLDVHAGDASFNQYETEIDLLIKEGEDYSWFQSGDYKKYIKFHILEFSNQNFSFGSKVAKEIHDPSRRLLSLKRVVHADQHYRNAELNSIQDCLNHLGYIYGIEHKTFTLKEAINEFSDEMVFISTGDLVSNSPDASLEEAPFDYLITKKFSRFGHHRDQLTDLSYLCFCHLDIAALLEDYTVKVFPGMPDLIVALNKIGGPAMYDVVLEGGKVPATKKIFFHIDDPGKIWSGPVHYRSRPPQGEPPPDWWDGWVGFVGGLRPDKLLDQPRLGSRIVPNKKIKFMEQVVLSGYYGGDSLYSDDPHKADYPFNALGEASNDSNYSFSSFQRSLDVLSRKQISKTNEKISESMERLLVESKESRSVDTFSEVSKRYSGNSYMIFGFDYYSAIKNYSSHGFLLENMSRELRSSILKKSKILSLKVYRRRVTDKPYGIGIFGSNIHRKFSNDQPDELVVHSMDGEVEAFKNKLKSKIEETETYPGISKTVLGKIEEYDVLLPEEPNPESFRYFLVDDYTFGSLATGTYTYYIEVLIKDSIKEEVAKKLTNFSIAIREYERFLTTASTPASKYRRFTVESQDPPVVPASEQEPVDPLENRSSPENVWLGPPPPAYDYNLKKFTEEFKDWLRHGEHPYKDIAHQIADVYVEMISIFDHKGRNSDDLALLRGNIIRNIDIFSDPTIENCQAFFRNLLDMQLMVTKLAATDTNLADNLSVNYDPTGRSSGSRSPNIIEVKKDFKKSVSAARSSVIMDYLPTIGSEKMTVSSLVSQPSVNRRELNVDASLPSDSSAPNYVYPERFLTSNKPESLGQHSIHVSDIESAGGLKRLVKRQESQCLKENLIFDYRQLKKMSTSKQSKIKYGLDNVRKTTAETKAGSAPVLYKEPYDISDYRASLNGLSIGLAGYGTAQAYKKIVYTKDKTITNEAFEALLSEATYLSSLGEKYSENLRKILRENENVLNTKRFMKYIELLKRAENFSKDDPTPYSNIQSLPGSEKVRTALSSRSYENPESLKDKYVLNNPAIIKIKSKVNSTGNSRGGPSDDYRAFTAANQFPESSRRGGRSKSRKVMIAKIEPIIFSKRGIGDAHSKNGFEVANDLILVEV